MYDPIIWVTREDIRRGVSHPCFEPFHAKERITGYDHSESLLTPVSARRDVRSGTSSETEPRLYPLRGGRLSGRASDKNTVPSETQILTDSERRVLF